MLGGHPARFSSKPAIMLFFVTRNSTTGLHEMLAAMAFISLHGCGDPSCPAGRVENEARACVCAEGSTEDGSGVCVQVTHGAADPSTPPANVSARYPWNGRTTGSVHAGGAADANNPLRPKFIWNSVMDATHYEFQLDDECPLETFGECAFPSPELNARIESTPPIENVVVFRPSENLPVSTEAPVGRRYYWRVRACKDDLCSEWTTVRYLDVGRLPSDYNCDGYSDLVAGAPTAQSEQTGGGNEREGKAFVFLGSSAGVADSPHQSYENPLNQAFGSFGSVVSSAGDVNADGCSDLLITAPGQDLAVSNMGETLIFLGSPEGLPSSADLRIENPLERSGAFGLAAAGAGDVNGDGYADIVVGARQQENGADGEGGVYLYFGSERGLVGSPSVSLDSPGNQASAEFGSSVAGIGDINGDGYADILAGARKHERGGIRSGSAFVFLGTPGDFPSAPSFTLEPEAPGDSFFGDSASGGGDLNADGYADYVVGAFGYTVNDSAQAGAVVVYFGSSDPTTRESVTLTLPSSVATQRFGQSVSAINDLNGDSIADLVVTAPDRAIAMGDSGQTYVYLGATGEFPQRPVFTYPAPAEIGLRKGRAVSSAGDLDGDGFYDLVSTRPMDDGGGRISIYFGPLTDQSPTDQFVANPGGGERDTFGTSAH